MDLPIDLLGGAAAGGVAILVYRMGDFVPERKTRSAHASEIGEHRWRQSSTDWTNGKQFSIQTCQTHPDLCSPIRIEVPEGV